MRAPKPDPLEGCLNLEDMLLHTLIGLVLAALVQWAFFSDNIQLCGFTIPLTVGTGVSVLIYLARKRDQKKKQGG